MDAALTLQKGLIFWTAVHMRRELVAAGGKSGAAALELGYTTATLDMGSESDGPLEEDEEEEVELAPMFIFEGNEGRDVWVQTGLEPAQIYI